MADDAETLVRELKDLHSCFEHGLERDRSMRFNVHGNGSGASTGFSIDHHLLCSRQNGFACDEIDDE